MLAILFYNFQNFKSWRGEMFHRSISRERVESVLKISRSSAGDLLRKMVLEKKIQKIGTTKSATYKKY